MERLSLRATQVYGSKNQEQTPPVWCQAPYRQEDVFLEKQDLQQINRELPGGDRGKEPTCQGRKRLSFDPWVRKIPWGRAWQPAPVFLPGEFHGQRSLVGYGPQGHKESDTIEAT